MEQAYETVKISALKKHPDNARRGNLRLIKESIEGNGFVGALIVQRSTGFILAGNHRFEAAKELGITDVPVIYVDVDDARARAIMLADNRTTDVATYDDRKLLELLESLPTLDGSTYDRDDLNDLLAAVQELPTFTVVTAPDGSLVTQPVNATSTSKFGVDGTQSNNNEPSYAERLEEYKIKNIRSIILDYEIDEFQRVVEKAAKAREANNVMTNADLFIALLDKEVD